MSKLNIFVTNQNMSITLIIKKWSSIKCWTWSSGQICNLHHWRFDISSFKYACVLYLSQEIHEWKVECTNTFQHHRKTKSLFNRLDTCFCLLPPMVLSWNSWNWPLTKRSTKLDLPTADSPSSTSLNWQILFVAVAPLGLVAPPPRPAIDRDRDWDYQGWRPVSDAGRDHQRNRVWRQQLTLGTQALMVSEVED